MVIFNKAVCKDRADPFMQTKIGSLKIPLDDSTSCPLATAGGSGLTSNPTDIENFIPSAVGTESASGVKYTGMQTGTRIPEATGKCIATSDNMLPAGYLVPVGTIIVTGSTVPKGSVFSAANDCSAVSGGTCTGANSDILNADKALIANLVLSGTMTLPSNMALGDSGNLGSDCSAGQLYNATNPLTIPAHHKASAPPVVTVEMTGANPFTATRIGIDKNFGLQVENDSGAEQVMRYACGYVPNSCDTSVGDVCENVLSSDYVVQRKYSTINSGNPYHTVQVDGCIENPNAFTLIKNAGGYLDLLA